MAITFTRERKKQRYLILVLALVILAIVLIVWWGFLRKEGEIPPPETLPIFVPPTVEINWEILKDPRLQELQVFEEIPPFEGEAGRENPFIPY